MIPHLPLQIELETKTILRKLASAHKQLDGFKDVTTGIPNQNILLDTLTLREARFTNLNYFNIIGNIMVALHY